MRRSVGLLVTSGLLPMIALGGAFGVVTLQSQRSAVKTRTETTARFAATLAATKLTDGMREVNMLAQSPAFDGTIDEARFTLLARRVKDSQSAWRTLSVADPAGRRILDIPAPIEQRRTQPPQTVTPRRVERSETPEPRVEQPKSEQPSRREEPKQESPPPRSEPRSEPKSEPRSEPKSEPKSEPRSEPKVDKPSAPVEVRKKDGR